MSRASTFSGMGPELIRSASAYLKTHDVKAPDYEEINLYVSREAQQNGNPKPTLLDVYDAIDAWRTEKPLADLPGPAKNFNFSLEDGSTVWGQGDHKTPKEWQNFIKDVAVKHGVEVKFSLVPGTHFVPNLWQRFLCQPETAQYRVSLKGDKCDVEKVADAYHHEMDRQLRLGE